MSLNNILDQNLLRSRFDRIFTETVFLPRCKPKILIVTDGGLGFGTGGFDLGRFIEAITTHASVTLQPVVTLAHRGAHPSPVSIGGVSYPVKTNFNFNTANPSVTKTNYDQVWLFGINSAGPISDAEVQKIAAFMNAGGGVFATGDHATLGSAISARLPRIRHMRDWASVPMGLETLPTATRRIDTVVNPGTNALYEFHDQSDNIPQRIYPNYAVTGPGAGTWTATIHPLLRMPGAPLSRTAGNPAQFSNDMDVLPDHPHESECFEISTTSRPAALNGTYTQAGLNFAEFPAAASGGGKVGAEIVAFSVSGGRSVQNGNWKPPVRPRMFGAMAAFDGHRANPLPGQAARPGRIVCDATWHHYVNINLDGSGSGRTGLGTGTGAGFVPSANLLKIYRYYQNILDWIQPSNRRICWVLYRLVAIRFHPALFEELVDPGELRLPGQVEALGRGAIELLRDAEGEDAGRQLVFDALRTDEKTAAIVDRLAAETEEPTPIDEEGFVAQALGQALIDLAQALPALDDARLEKAFADKGHEALEKKVHASIAAGARAAVEQQAKSFAARAKAIERIRKSAGELA